VRRWTINRDRVAWQVIGGEAVVIDLVGGKALGFNRSGSLVWEMLSGSTEEEITTALCKRFGGRRKQVLTDVRLLIEELARRGLVVEAGATPEADPATARQPHFSRRVLDVMRRQRS